MNNHDGVRKEASSSSHIPIMSTKLSLLILLLFAITTMSTVSLIASDVVTTFRSFINENKLEEAASLVADDAFICTPFGKKTKEQFFKSLQQGNHPVWGESKLGLHKHQCITEGIKKFGIVNVQLKETIEINDSSKIQQIIVTKK